MDWSMNKKTRNKKTRKPKKNKKPKISKAMLDLNRVKKPSDVLDIISDPKRTEQILELVRSSNELAETTKTVRSVNLVSWVNRVIPLLPPHIDEDEFRTDLIKLIKTK